MKPQNYIFNKVFEESKNTIRIIDTNNYYTNDLDDYTEENIMYVGKEKNDGTWLIMKLDMTSGIIIRGASSINNSTYSTYTDAWNNRTSLIYDYLKEVL